MPEKFEREIDEILRKASFSSVPGGGGHSPGWMASLAAGWQQLVADVSPARLLAYGLGLALAGYVFRWFVPEAAGPLTLLALVFLVGGLIASMSRRRARPPSGWRGRQFETNNQQFADIWQSLKRRWANWRRGRGWSDR